MVFKLKRQFSALSSFGLLGALVLGSTMPMAMLVNPYFQVRRSVGFRVQIVKNAQQVNGAAEPIVVRIARKNHIYVNFREAALQDLLAAVREAQGAQIESPALVDAGPDVEYGEVISVVDVLSGAHIKVVLMSSVENHERTRDNHGCRLSSR
jgi:biopolymer transport protein ExbD